MARRLLVAARMVRSLLLIGFVVFIGCGSSNDNGTGGNGGGGADLSAAAGGGGDLAMTLPADMQPAYGCHALLACRDACTDQASCNLCLQSASMQALGLYGMLRNCIRRTCSPHPDSGPAPCTNGGGMPSPQCTMCQDDSIKMTGSCGSDTTYCGACYNAWSACEANLP